MTRLADGKEYALTDIPVDDAAMHVDWQPAKSWLEPESEEVALAEPIPGLIAGNLFRCPKTASN